MSLTVTLHVSFLLPFSVFAVIIAVPFDFATILPVDDTDTTLGLLDDQYTVLFTTLLGVKVTFIKPIFCPTEAKIL